MIRAVALAAVLLLPLAIAQDERPTWPDGKTNWFGHSPIRIHLDLSNLTTESAGFADQARQALRYWENGGNGRVAWDVEFVEVGLNESPDIVLWFRDEARSGPLCLESEQALGCARPFDRPVPIEILARRKGGDFISYQLARQVTQHEVGHALGFPHSSLPGDIMAPHASSRAAGTYRPGDWQKMLVGAVVLVAAIAGGVWLFLRVLRRPPDVHPLAGPADAPCPARRFGMHHQFAPLDVDAHGEVVTLQVCRSCRGALPPPR